MRLILNTHEEFHSMEKTFLKKDWLKTLMDYFLEKTLGFSLDLKHIHNME